MNHRKVVLRAACALGIVGVGAPALAQAWIGEVVGNMMANQVAYQREVACRNGVPMVDKEVTEARTPALAAMGAYWQAAKAGGSFANQFHIDKHAQWISGGTVARAEQVGGQADPFAHAGLTFDSAPIGFVRASDGASALGQWIVRDEPGTRRGTYTATFIRKLGEWRLSTLTLTGAREYAEPVVQYCHKPQDVLTYRLESSAADVARLENALPKAEQKLAKHEKALADARAKAARSSASDVDRLTLADETAREQHLATQVETMRMGLAQARTARADALAEAKAKEDAKAAALRELAAAG